MAERMMTNHSPRKARSYEAARRCFAVGVAGRGDGLETVAIPFEDGTVLPSLFLPPASEGRRGPAPCLVMFNGFDVTKEIVYLLGLDEVARHGIAVLFCDQPGSGGALRNYGLPTRPDMEVAAAACIDHLAGRADVDPARIAVAGISMGGYFAPRAAAFDDRVAACVAWGAFHDLIGVATNLATTGAHSAPAFQIPWVFGVEDQSALARYAEQFTLDGVAEKITCPLLVVHGAEDRQVPVAQAHRTVEQAEHAARRDLVVFPSGEWGDQHCQVDDPSLAVDLIADWLEEVLQP
jgi:dipeptidyl aminopeptidase/acylaminoacyl peptidase